jgi:mannosyltransferase OCH1-like enzyme
MSHSFPKIIWQTHNYKQKWLPDHLKCVSSAWINLNPGWDYRYVDQVQRDETVKKYPQIYEVYQYQPPSIQSDIWRFIITYENGGCYADMDSVPTVPLDYMIETIGQDPEMITVPLYQDQGNTHNFIVKADSEIMKEIIAKMSGWAQKSETEPQFSKFEPFKFFIKITYSLDHYDKVSKRFDVMHTEEYKNAFPTEHYKVNDYGNILQYEDFIKEKGLPMMYTFD